MTSETDKTTYSDKCAILADLWINYRDDQDFIDFQEYNDLGLPLAYAIDNDIISSTPLAQNLIEETFDLLLAGLEIEDTGFESLDDLLSMSSN